MNCAEPEPRVVLGNKTTMLTKQGLKPNRKYEKVLELDEATGKKPPSITAVHSKLWQVVPSILKSNLLPSASCSSDASIDLLQSRASMGRIRQRGLANSAMRIRRKQSDPKSERLKRDIESESCFIAAVNGCLDKKSCAWVTPNTDNVYHC